MVAVGVAYMKDALTAVAGDSASESVLDAMLDGLGQTASLGAFGKGLPNAGVLGRVMKTSFPKHFVLSVRAAA